MQSPGVSGESAHLTESAIAHIRRQIATGRLREGQRVKELEIARDLGISRGPVREAVARLSASGLLNSTPNQGARVAVLTEATVRHVFQVRESLESLGASLASRNMDKPDRHALYDLIEKHEEVAAEGSPSKFPGSEDDWDFHTRILYGSGNTFVARICCVDLRDMLALIRARQRFTEERGTRVLLEHRWIAGAIRESQAELAGALMAQHIRSALEHLLATRGGGEVNAPA